MWFFKKQKRAVTEEDIFSKDPCLYKLPVNPHRNEPEYKRVESIFNQANVLYTQARDILQERNPRDLDDESKKKYFDLLIESYNTLLSHVDDKGLYIEFPIIDLVGRLCLSLHRDLALCYSEGIGVTADDYERRRHLGVEGLLLSFFIEASDFEPSSELRFLKRR